MKINVNISVQVEEEAFEKAQSILAKRGMSISTAFAMFLERIANDKELPFWEDMTKE